MKIHIKITNQSFMDFLFHVPFFCTAAATVAEICLKILSFVSCSFRPNIISRVPKLPE
jgi:hypothetical protein